MHLNIETMLYLHYFGSFGILTLHVENNWLAGLIFTILIIDSLGIVATCIWCHCRQDDQGVVQSESSETRNTTEKRVRHLDQIQPSMKVLEWQGQFYCFCYRFGFEIKIRR